MISVLVGDTQPLFAESLATALGRQPGFQLLKERPRSGPAAVRVSLEKKPDISLLDFWLGEMGGPAVANYIQKRSPPTRVVLLAWFYGAAELRSALGAGAAGFLPKSLRLHQVAEALRRVHEGAGQVYPSELDQLVTAANRDEAARVWSRLATVTPRELEVLRLLGAGWSKNDIAAGLSISPETVRTHIARILRKLNSRTQNEAVATARHYELIQP